MGIRITTLGSPRIFRDGEELTSLPGKPMRCALLLYLAVERSSTREELMNLFWGEKHPEKARRALTQMLYELRQDLGDEWLETGGDTLRVTDAVEVDILQLQDAVEEERYEEAAQGCAGTFVEGIRVADSRAFEGWVDRWQSRLGRSRQKIFRELVQRRYGSDDLPGALAAARSWAECDPLEDEAHHHLFQLLAESGQRAEALREYDGFRDRLRRELEVEPMEDTLELIGAIRDGEFVAKPIQELVAPVRDRTPMTGEEDSAPSPEPGPPVSRLTRIVRRARRELAVFAVAAVIILGIWWILPPRIPELDPNKIVAFPLVDQRGGFDEGVEMATVLGSALEYMEPLKWIHGWNRLSAEQRRDPTTVTAEDARAISIDRRAGFFLQGAIVRVGDSVSVTLRLYDTDGDSLVTQNTAKGLLSETSTAQIAVGALGPLLPPILDPGRRVDLGVLEDRAPEAVVLWVQGERDYRAARFGAAFDLYRDAVVIDSLLAPAAIKAAQAANWHHRNTEAEQMVALAARHDTLLSPRQRHFARGLQAYFAGEADSAVAAFRRALSRDPEWSEAWTALGEVYEHLMPTDAVVPDSANAAFERSLGLERDFQPPLIHLAEHAIQRGDVPGSMRLIERIQLPEPDLSNLHRLSLMLQCVQNGPDRERWRQANLADSSVVLNAGILLAAGGSQPECAEGAFRSLLEDEGFLTNWGWGALTALSGLLTAQGRMGDLRALLEDATSAGRGGALGYLYLIGPAIGLDTEQQGAEAVARMRDMFGDEYRGVALMTGWALGVWHSAHGEVEALRALTAETRLRALETGARKALLLASALDGHLALAEGDTTGAIALFRELRPTAPYPTMAWDWAESLAVERLVLARLLKETGQEEEAYRVAEEFDHPGPVIHLYMLAESLAIRHETATRLGWTELADRCGARLEHLGRLDLLESKD